MTLSGLCLCQAPGLDNLGVRGGDRHLGVSMKVRDREGVPRAGTDLRWQEQESLEQRPWSDKLLGRRQVPAAPGTRAPGLPFSTGPFLATPTLLPLPHTLLPSCLIPSRQKVLSWYHTRQHLCPQHDPQG